MNRILHITSVLLFLAGVASSVYADETGRISIGGNVYGGGEAANVGSTDVTINEGRYGKNIFGGGEGELYDGTDGEHDEGTVKASADVTGSTSVTINGGEFAVRHEDVRTPGSLTDFAEHYNIYGGGNIASSVGETHVYVKRGMISKDSDGSGLGVHDDGTFLQNSNEKGIAQAYYKEGQMYFCIFGGGYGKNTNVTGNTWVDFNISGMTDINSTAIEDDLLEYQSYLDVIGGGFNGTVKGNTNVHVGGNAMCRNVYGGGLYAAIGTQDDAEKGNTNVHITGGNIDNVYGGGVMGDILTSTNVNIGLHGALNFDFEKDGITPRTYQPDNDKVTILMSVFGANDVSGKVPTANITHNGGTVDQNIYGAGNGNYRGYYTPNVCDYAEGDNDNYYYVNHSGDTSQDGKGTKGPKGNTYKGRPQTGNVSITIAGNSTTDKAQVLGQVFGGGNSCTIGDWKTIQEGDKHDGDPHKWRDDPDYFLGGGELSVNIGSHVKIGRTHAELAEAEDGEEYLNDEGENVSGLFMGCSGKYLATQSTAEDDYTYHHYYDHYTAKYWPGFAVFADDGTPLNREEGLASFNAYLNNILIWSDNVSLTIADNVEDVWLSNFVGGGFRGSMKAKSHNGHFHYSLPRGVTIGHDIVGGAYNTDVVYRVFDTEDDMHTYTETDGHYNYCKVIKPEWTKGTDYHHVEYAEDGETITGVVRFYYDGGILKSSAAGDEDRVGKVFTEYSMDNETPGNDNVIDFSGYTSEKGIRKYKDYALVYVDARCQLEPEIIDGHVHGGNVLGGCFESGTIDGDIWTDYRCYIAPRWYGNENFNGGQQMFSNAADYQTNFAMMAFGAGYGKNTSIKGDVYLRIMYNKENGTASYPCLYNVFGGSYQGTVDGNTNIYYNAGQQGLCVGGIYGGGSQGYVAGKSFVELAGGYIANVYGGAREANVGKGTHVWAYDGALRNWADDLTEHDNAPLVVERMFGGSDVSGLIGFKADATDVSDDSKRVTDAGWTAHFSKSLWPEELYDNYDPENPPTTGLKKFDSYIQIGGTDHSDRGYPLVGQIYAGGNGENTDTEHGQIIPGIDYALIELNDGNVIEAFGGGNAATIHKQNYILTNGQHAPVNVITMPNTHLTQIMKERVLKHAPDCYTLSGNTFTFKPYNVQRLFGGNNVATMAIQPKWNLKSGHLGSVYSGGNMGDMTYYNPAPAAGESKGLSITVNSDNIHIDALYGGCRMSDVKAMNGSSPAVLTVNEYGATVNVIAGYIDNVYGGNDISGNVYNGTNVNISGAVSGNVYGSGNGNYYYKWDKDATKVTEDYNDQYNFTFYRVPMYYGGAEANAAEKILTINHWRPSVSKAYLNISGTAEKVAYVKGNVYCGGNASTVEGVDSYTKFDIGSYVTLNGVFMGSDGMEFSHSDVIRKFEALNGFDMTSAVEWTDACNDAVAEGDRQFYPSMLSLYMKAVEMDALPQGFQASLNQSRTNAYIGTFCGGGNCGSMTIGETVNMTIPSNITIYDKVVAGCLDANVTYKNGPKEITNIGGYYRPMANSSRTIDPERTKLNYTVECKFVPKVMDVPEDMNGTNTHGEDFATAKAKSFLYDNVATAMSHRKIVDVYGNGCNIYGGCYHSGDVLGDVVLNVKSAMLEKPLQNNDITVELAGTLGGRQLLQNTVDAERAAFNIYGAGYGLGSHVYGNVTITLDNTPEEGTLPEFNKLTCPSASNINGGGRSGYLYGNSYINVLNGIVYNNVIGGSDAGYQYGSTHIAVGDPVMYECTGQGEYTLDRADKWNEDKKNHDGTKPVTTSMKLMVGDRVSEAVYNKIPDSDHSKFTACYVPGSANGSRLDWTNRKIHIGAGIYAGGYALATGSAVYAGDYTVRKLNEENRWKNAFTGADDGEIGYAGNANIMIADDPANATSGTTDHITISTIVDKVTSGMKSKMGFFTRTDTHTTNALGDPIYSYDHQSDGAPAVGTTYYQLSGNGGIYGDGHLSFVEGFRSADIQRYGYAEHVPQDPKLLNTLQRLDLVRVQDCCVMLQGATDFAINAKDGEVYSIARVRELYLESTISPTATLDKGIKNSDLASADRRHETRRSRNYLGFFNSVHYIGAIATNDDFSTSSYHNEEGTYVSTKTYQTNKQEYITADYNESTHEILPDYHYDHFKQRNIGTARNMIGINNGYTLKIQNVYTTATQQSDGSYVDVKDHIYYGPIVGVAEVKLLTLVVGEGGGYVYADNVHSDGSHFMNTSGNFVFPGTVDPMNPQYVVDDCFSKNFAGTATSTAHQNPEAYDADRPAHYWYVMGNKYFFTNTITAYTFGEEGFTGPKDLYFDMDNLDQIITLSGTKKTDVVRIKNIVWEHPHDSHYTQPGQSCDIEDTEHKTGYTLNLSASISDKYNTDGGYTPLPRTDEYTGDGEYAELTYAAGKDNGQESPLLAIRLNDSEVNNTQNYWRNHLSDPCRVTFDLESGTGDPSNIYTYHITLNIVYVQGPRVTGELHIDNCAMPGELIHAEAKDLVIETDDAMPVTGTAWRFVNPDPDAPDDEKYDYVVSYNKYIDHSKADVLAKYRYNGWGLQYVVNAGGNSFPVSLDPESEFESILVHNYHDMKHVNVVKGDARDNLDPQVGARIYIKDKTDWDAFVEYLNAATPDNAYGIPVGMAGIKVYLQSDLTLDAVPAITQPFAGELSGDGYVLCLPETEYETPEPENNALFPSGALADGAKVYNLGVVNAGSIKADGNATIENCFVYTSAQANDPAFLYGEKAYDLSHNYHTTDADDGYINGNRYAKGREIETDVYEAGDWQYARLTSYDGRMLRTGEPYYGSVETRHNAEHAAAEIEAHDCLFFGQTLAPVSDGSPVRYPQHIDDSKDDMTGNLNEANRVYRTAGYYRSTARGAFHYNKAAWALQPTLTAIDFADSNPDDDADGLDDRHTALTSFNSDCNATVDDVDKVTKNLLVYHSESAIAAEADNTAEAAVLYHPVKKVAEAYSTPYFHLVDKQDFCAPIAFTVNSRAWYVRTPVSCAESNNSAWEGICLPFTVKKVTASTNREISHFYGTPTGDVLTDPMRNDKTLHHEYWLRGLVSVIPDDGDETIATFQRPGTEEGLFSTAAQTAAAFDYTYAANSYFTGLTGYNSTDNPWYTASHTFAGYKPLTANIPYIVSFPGERYYEFDLNGQTITFSSDNTTVPVTENLFTSENGYSHMGTFLHKSDAAYGMNSEGTAFESTTSDVLPFRTYMTEVAANDEPGYVGQLAKHSIIFIGGDSESIVADDERKPQPEQGEQMLMEGDYLRIYPIAKGIVVESGSDRLLPCHGISGTRLGTWDIRKGRNTFSNLRTGVYVVGGTKVVVR